MDFVQSDDELEELDIQTGSCKSKSTRATYNKRVQRRAHQLAAIFSSNKYTYFICLLFRYLPRNAQWVRKGPVALIIDQHKFRVTAHNLYGTYQVVLNMSSKFFYY